MKDIITGYYMVTDFALEVIEEYCGKIVDTYIDKFYDFTEVIRKLIDISEEK